MRKLWCLSMFVLVTSVILLFAGFPTGAAADEPVTRGQLADILKNINKAVTDGDLAAFEKLTVAPRPDMKLTPEEFADAKARMLELFPPLSSIDPVKFALGEKASLVVVRFGLEDKESIHLRAYRFTDTKEGWKLLLKFTSKSITAKDPAADKAAITRELEATPDFQLAEVEEKQRPDMPAPTTLGLGNHDGAGFLSVAGEIYSFKHSMAYKTKSGEHEKTVVIVSDTPIDRDKLKAKVKKLGTWTGFQNHVMITFDQKGQPASFSLWVKQDSTSVSSPGSDLKSDVLIEGDQIIGKVMMKATETQFESDYYFEVAFKTDIITP
ncbi:hypothetical protein KAI46_05140 [bacterium]|nr:hypothetical protein [bacterium]